MFKKIAIGLGLLIAGVCAFAAMQPADYKVSRELTMRTTAEAVFPYINNSEKTNEWMPWKDADPELKLQYSGPNEGVGSKSSWDSSGDMGTGESLVIESVQNKHVKTQLTYLKPMSMTQEALLEILPAGDGAVTVRWSVSGKNSFIGRVFCLFMSMDKMVGGEFEKGLAKLKMIVEK